MIEDVGGTLALLQIALFAALFFGLGYAAGYLHGHSNGQDAGAGRPPKKRGS